MEVFVTYIYFVHGRVAAVVTDVEGRIEADRVVSERDPDLGRLLADRMMSHDAGLRVVTGGTVDGCAPGY